MMGRENMLRVPEEVLRSMFILEDDLPREGGAQPEYAATMSICVDAFENGLASGRVCSYFARESRGFQSLDQMLFAVEELLDLSGVPMRDTELRKTIPAVQPGRRKKPERNGKETAEPMGRTPLCRPGELRIQRGRVTSFYIRVFARQHTSVQGVVAWTEKGTRMEAFRSGMELMSLIWNTLDDLKG